LGGAQKRGETLLLTEKSLSPQWISRAYPKLNVSTTQMSTGIYVRLLRKRCVSVDQASLRSIAAEGIYSYVV